MNTINSLKPGLYLLKICGYFPLKITVDDKLELSAQSLYYSLVLVFLFVVLSIYSIFFEKLEDNLESTVSFILLILVNFVICFTLLESCWKRSFQKEMIENFAFIDDYLRRRFAKYNSGFNLRRNIITLFTLHALNLVIILGINIAILLTSQAPGELNYLAFYFVGYSLSSLRYLQIIYFTWMIRRRLCFLKRTMEQLEQEKRKSARPQILEQEKRIKTIRFLDQHLAGGGHKIAPLRVREVTMDCDLTKMNVLRDVYHKLWINSQLFNRAFGLSLLLNIGYDFLALTTDLYWIIVSYSTVVANMNPSAALFG